jgi:DNA-binding cell septation regulator SpoVG
VHIGINWHGQQFNIELSSQHGKDPFLTVRGCRIVNGSKGEFISMPSTKNEATGKYWNHAIASDAFQKTVLELAKASQPQESRKASDIEDEIPF